MDVLDEAEQYRLKFNLDEVAPICILAAVVTPGVGFSFDQLKTMPLSPGEICDKMGAGSRAATPAWEAPSAAGSVSSSCTGLIAKYCTDKVAEAQEGKLPKTIGFEKETDMICEILGRKYKANLLVTGEEQRHKSRLT